MTDFKQNQLARINKISEEFQREASQRENASYTQFPYKLNPTKILILKELLELGTCMVTDLWKKLNVSSGAMTIILNQLENDNLITRSRDEKDKRIIWLHLTPEGEKLIKGVLKYQYKKWERLLSALTEEEVDTFLMLLEKITKSFQEAE